MFMLNIQVQIGHGSLMEKSYWHDFKEHSCIMIAFYKGDNIVLLHGRPQVGARKEYLPPDYPVHSLGTGKNVHLKGCRTRGYSPQQLNLEEVRNQLSVCRKIPTLLITISVSLT